MSKASANPLTLIGDFTHPLGIAATVVVIALVLGCAGQLFQLAKPSSSTKKVAGGDENLHESEKTDAESESGGIRGGAGEENVVREESDAKACTGEEIDGGGEFDEPDESKHEN